jgi:CO/xanthine dehydrogenase Mo-binding subunit
VRQPAPRNLSQPTGGGDRNALPLYAFPNQLITKHLVLESPRFVSALRALGAYANVFAIESFVDELALAAGKDPLDMRLEYLDDERARAVLESLRDVLRAEPERREGFWSGRGLGFARYKNLGAYASVVCEVQVNKRTGAVTVPHAFAAIDAGLVINPDGLSNQIEGGIVQSTSWTLKEAVRLGGAAEQSEDWSGYPVLRFTEAPRVTVNIIDSSEPSLGAGEAVQGPAAGAIGNAIAAACGARLRDLPLLPHRVLDAIPKSLRAASSSGQ